MDGPPDQSVPCNACFVFDNISKCFYGRIDQYRWQVIYCPPVAEDPYDPCDVESAGNLAGGDEVLVCTADGLVKKIYVAPVIVPPVDPCAAATLNVRPKCEDQILICIAGADNAVELRKTSVGSLFMPFDANTPPDGQTAEEYGCSSVCPGQLFIAGDGLYVKLPDGTCCNLKEVDAPPPGALMIEKSAQQMSFSAAGDVLTFNFTVTNTGTTPVTNITVTDNTATVSGGPLASLAAGASDSTTFTATYTVTQADVDAGQVVNLASVAGTDENGDPVTGSDDTTVPVEIPPMGNISLVKTASPTTFNAVGDVITYSFTVTNNGTDPVTNITIADNTAAVTGGPLGTLAGGASDSTTFTATYTVTQADVDAGEVVNVATASGTGPDNNPVTATGTDTSTLGECETEWVCTDECASAEQLLEEASMVPKIQAAFNVPGLKRGVRWKQSEWTGSLINNAGDQWSTAFLTSPVTGGVLKLRYRNIGPAGDWNIAANGNFNNANGATAVRMEWTVMEVGTVPLTPNANCPGFHRGWDLMTFCMDSNAGCPNPGTYETTDGLDPVAWTIGSQVTSSLYQGDCANDDFTPSFTVWVNLENTVGSFHHADIVLQAGGDIIGTNIREDISLGLEQEIDCNDNVVTPARDYLGNTLGSTDFLMSCAELGPVIAGPVGGPPAP